MSRAIVYRRVCLFYGLPVGEGPICSSYINWDSVLHSLKLQVFEVCVGAEVLDFGVASRFDMAGVLLNGWLDHTNVIEYRLAL